MYVCLFQMTKKISRTLENTRFSGVPILPVAAKPGGPEAPETERALGVDRLVEVRDIVWIIYIHTMIHSFAHTFTHWYNYKHTHMHI